MVGRECRRVFCVAPLAESTQTTVIFSNALTEPRLPGLVLLGPQRSPKPSSPASCRKSPIGMNNSTPPTAANSNPPTIVRKTCLVPSSRITEHRVVHFDVKEY